MEHVEHLLWWGLALSIPLGAVINKTNFCTMGGLSDWVNFGSRSRFYAWLLAAAVAMLGVGVLQATGSVSLAQTIPPYHSSTFAWPRYVLGGFLFGIGMTLAGGCFNKTLVNIGRGNLKSLLVAVVGGFFAYLMTKTDFYGVVFHGWMSPLFVDLAQYGISNQSLPALLARMGGSEAPGMALVLGCAIVLALVIVGVVLRAREFRSRPHDWGAGIVLGLAVTAAWYLTGGPLGREVMEAVEWLDQRPISIGVQSLTFANPLGEWWVFTGSPSRLLLSFGMVCALGVMLGSLGYALLSRSFRVQGFVSWGDTLRHVAGGVLMGIGGVLGMGCTIGQGVTGASTLALGSLLVFASIVFGSVLTLKLDYYRVVYEDSSFWREILPSVLAEMRLLPSSLRRLERP